MVRSQLACRDVHDPRVLDAMARIPRPRFIPGCRKGEGYGDYPLPIGHQQTISQPYMVGFMTQALRLRGSERVLEVGTGSGYQTAVLAELCSAVYSVERIRRLHERALTVLEELGYSNVHLRHGDGYHGWPEQAPFDRILVTAAASELPQPLCDQLGDGGIMVLPLGDVHGFQRVVIVRREGDRLRSEESLGCRFVPLVRAP